MRITNTMTANVRRWPNIKSTLGERLVFAAMSCHRDPVGMHIKIIVL